jgi:2',3'-cyclic-nucleotide 2'-phosphodiesterase (5'-nucleotidase family)
MKRFNLMLALLFVAVLSIQAQDYSWTAVPMDGSRTGCTSATKDNVSEALGTFVNGAYHAPNGRVYKSNTSVAKVAAIVHAAQPAMAEVKSVIAYSDDAMSMGRGESNLSNWFVGIIMDGVEALAGKKVDVGICNFGGIRVSMPKGPVTLDDMYSMFPFKNTVVYLEMKGSDLRKLFEKMAATHFQAIGGVEIVAENGKLTKALVGGKPISDNKLYGIATISFLLYGGDSLTLADNALNMQMFDDEVIDIVLAHLDALKQQGKNISAPSVKYVTVK